MALCPSPKNDSVCNPNLVRLTKLVKPTLVGSLPPTAEPLPGDASLAAPTFGAHTSRRIHTLKNRNILLFVSVRIGAALSAFAALQRLQEATTRLGPRPATRRL
eukprot:GHVU01126480.1.p1 GENE.GHVU01126480.1~~GHVU01126480.1.p1  ORF type:complete len:104 (+),score=2.30 GHVU01126480.1:149-460(+)